MKSSLKKRISAFMLCMVLVLSSATSVLADDANANNTGNVEANQKINSEPAAVSEEADSTEQTEIEPEEATAETDQGKSQTEQPASEAAQPSQPEADTQQQTEQPSVAENTPVQEAMELKQDMKDADGNAVCTVTANIPEGTFAGVSSSDVTMEVTEVEAGTAEAIKGLIEKDIAEGKALGEYFLYSISFKVNGETAEPGREIKITFDKKDFKIGDTNKATVFYYNEAHSIAGNETAEIKEIIQKSDKLKELQGAGQSTADIENFDLTEISLKEDGTAGRIQTEGRRSTVYGCYVEEEKSEDAQVENTLEEETTKEEPVKETKPAKALNYEDDDVFITVSAEKEGIIPENSRLQVVPILSDDKATKEQYKEVEDKLNKKAEEEEYDVAGFLAYDISFVDDEGNEVEPDGDVKVTIDYKNEVIPDGVEGASNLDVTVMHLEEGESREIVDLTADAEQEATVELTESTKVKKVEFKTNSFSAYIIAWTDTQAKNRNYEKAATAIGIKDDIIESGRLLPLLTDGAVDEGDVVTYKWYRSKDDGNTWEAVRRQKITGDEYNIAKDGSWINPSLDGGARTSEKTTYYKVVLVINGSESLTKQSEPYLVDYWAELQNGSFETPSIVRDHVQMSNKKYKEANGVWQTTGIGTGKHAGADIEILNTKYALNANYNWYGPQVAADGTQFAELNCEASGALYQDVITIPGTTLNYWLSHRARGTKRNSTPEKDTMYVLIMPTKLALVSGDNGSEVDTQSEVNRIMTEINKGSTAYPGTYVKDYTSNDQKWSHYNGQYPVMDNQYLTRFFFVAGPTASKNNTVGNFLDEVGFSSELPPANPGEVTLNLVKNFHAEGMTNEQIEAVKNSLSFHINDITVQGSEMTWSHNGNEYIGSKLVNISAKADSSNRLEVSENTDKSGLGNVTLDSTTVQVNNETASDGTSAVITLKETESGTVTFNNKYLLPTEEDKPYIIVKKTFEGLTNPFVEVKHFEIKVYKDSALTDCIATLSLNDNNVEESEDGFTYIWTIENVDAGTYYVVENGEECSGYTVSTTINGKEADTAEAISVQTADAQLTLDDCEVVTKCSNNTIKFGDNTGYIAATLTDKSDKNEKQYFVWTRDTLSAAERIAIVNKISGSTQGDLRQINAPSSRVYFYSKTDKIEEGITVKEAKISIKDGYVYFANTSQWKMICYGDYNTGENQNAEIDIKNSYQGKQASINIKKYGTSYAGAPIAGAKFSLYKGTKNELGFFTWDIVDDYKEIDVTTDKIELVNLSAGNYKLVETSAPSGYMLLDEAIYFKIVKGAVTLTDSKGDKLLTGPDMWELVSGDSTNPIYTIKVKNNILYALPDAGGSGTYWYSIGGMLLMIAAALILYKNRCREVLKS